MKKLTKKQVQEKIEQHCDDCLRLQTEEYLRRASFRELKALKSKIELLLSSPFNTDVSEEDRAEQGVMS